MMRLWVVAVALLLLAWGVAGCGLVPTPAEQRLQATVEAQQMTIARSEVTPTPTLEPSPTASPTPTPAAIVPPPAHRPLWDRASYGCTNTPPVGIDRIWQVSAPRGYPAPVRPGGAVQLGLRNKLGEPNEHYYVAVTVIAPNGTSAMTTTTLWGSEWAMVVYPNQFPGAPPVYPGVYTVVWETKGAFLACDGLVVEPWETQALVQPTLTSTPTRILPPTPTPTPYIVRTYPERQPDGSIAEVFQWSNGRYTKRIVQAAPPTPASIPTLTPVPRPAPPTCAPGLERFTAADRATRLRVGYPGTNYDVQLSVRFLEGVIRGLRMGTVAVWLARSEMIARAELFGVRVYRNATRPTLPPCVYYFTDQLADVYDQWAIPKLQAATTADEVIRIASDLAGILRIAAYQLDRVSLGLEP